MGAEKQYGIGVDFGTDSVRASLVAYMDGKVLASTSVEYPRWKQELYCESRIAQFRQHPLDYQESLISTLEKLLAPFDNSFRSAVGSIGVGATGSTVAPVNETGTPLAILPPFRDDPAAMFHLWKDHTSSEEASSFNTLAGLFKESYTRFQGRYSSEWFWAKIAHTGKQAPHIKEASNSWIELCDWIIHLLVGGDAITYRSKCAATHKALWNSNFGGLPSMEFLRAFDSYAASVRENYTQQPEVSTVKTGTLNKSWASLLGLPENVIIGGSSLDAHAGAVGAGIKEGTLVSVLGTSAVHMILLPFGKESQMENLTRYAGLAEDSIIPGFWGVESGQAAFGDVLSWFSRLLSTFVESKESLLPRMDKLLEHTKKEHTVTALEWLNGRRYPDTSDAVRGALLSLDLSTDAASLYGALSNAILFGLKRIVQGMQESGISIKQVRVTGGIARKSPVLMQRLSTILNLPILVLMEKETCALGAAMYGAVAMGRFPDLGRAQIVMAAKEGISYTPNREDVPFYAELYEVYLQYGQALETVWK
nr:ribulokinase [uncultured Sphaerochaeta sp.]